MECGQVSDVSSCELMPRSSPCSAAPLRGPSPQDGENRQPQGEPWSSQGPRRASPSLPVGIFQFDNVGYLLGELRCDGSAVGPLLSTLAWPDQHQERSHRAAVLRSGHRGMLPLTSCETKVLPLLMTPRLFLGSQTVLPTFVLP